MPRSSSTSSDAKSSTRNTTSPASRRNFSGSSAKAASASAAISSSDGAEASRQGAPRSLIGDQDMRRLGGGRLEEADVERLLRLDRPQRLLGELAQLFG